MVIRFIDLNKKQLKLYLGFSWWYFFLGPIYLLFRKKIFLSISLLVLYYWMLPFSGLKELTDFTQIDGSIVAKTLLIFKEGFMIIIGILTIFVTHILMTLHIEKYIVRKKIDKYGLLPATNDDAERLSRVIKEYQDLPVHPSYIKEITFLSEKYDKTSTGDLKRGKVVTGQTTTLVRKTRLDQQKQTHLNTLYEKYNSGFITFEELLEMQQKIVEL